MNYVVVLFSFVNRPFLLRLIRVRPLIVNFVHFMAKHYRHQNTKAQKRIANQRCLFVALCLRGNFSGLSGLGNIH